MPVYLSAFALHSKLRPCRPGPTDSKQLRASLPEEEVRSADLDAIPPLTLPLYTQRGLLVECGCLPPSQTWHFSAAGSLH